MKEEIRLGDYVKDIITGFRGVVVAKALWLTGCNRLGLIPTETKDGTIPDPVWIDEELVEVIERERFSVDEIRGSSGPCCDDSRPKMKIGWDPK